jgi:enterochelin esterase-like enzyme
VLFPNLPSAWVEPRNVCVWLPRGYDESRRHPVIYAFDGQNLFDPRTSFLGIDWGLDEALTSLIEAGEVPAPLVAGIWNVAERPREYTPRRPFADWLDSFRKEEFLAECGSPTSDELLRFITTELKPLVDREFATLPDAAHTLALGSSLGGLMSAYALCEYPEVFGSAGCVSTHWPALEGAMERYLEARLPAPGRHRLYFDYGTETLDADYEPYQAAANSVMKRRGYTEGKDWITLKFSGDEHSERAWRRRVHIPLRFLLGPLG